MNFAQYVDQHSVRIPFSGCSIWTGAVTHGGYARSALAQKLHGTTIVHRALFQELHGEVPIGKYVCHQCDTPSCVNPDHLFLGTPSDNAQDRKVKGRSAPKTGSKNGRSRLTENDVLKIKKEIESGRALLDISLLFNVSEPTIRHIKEGRTWRHL